MKRLAALLLLLLATVLPLGAQRSLNVKSVLIDSGYIICNSDTLEIEKGRSDVYSLLAQKWNIEAYASDNETRFAFLDTVRVVYVLEFSLTEAQLSYREAQLSFECSDTYFSVSLNGMPIERRSNERLMFCTDVMPMLKEGRNELRVEIGPTAQQLETVDAAAHNILASEKRAAFRKAAFRFGWDWAPRQLAGEVFLPAKLELGNSDILIRFAAFQTKDLGEKEAEMRLSLVVPPSAASDLRAEVRYTDGKNRTFTTGKLHATGHKHLNESSVLDFDFTVSAPELWYPAGYGEQRLYEAGIVLFDRNGRAIDSAQTRFGIRRISLEREKDTIGESYFFVCNTRKLFAKGANLVPTRMHGETYSSLAKHMDLVRDCYMNMLRVWGGGFYLDDESLTACDEEGILIWQDFPFACALYPADSAYLAGVRRDAEENTLRLASHPCLALFCGNNEVFEGWENWGWKKEVKDTAAALEAYETLFKKELKEVVERFAPFSSYVHTSPIHGWGKAQSMTEGDSHYWGVWWGDSVFETYTRKVPRFMSEYGFQSPPCKETMLRYFAAPYVKANPQFAIHQKHPRGFELIDTRVQERFTVAQGEDAYWDLAAMTAEDAYRIAIEAHRRAMPRCMGSLLWQLNEPYPAIGWSIIDVDWKKKPVYRTVQKSFAPIILSIDRYSCEDSAFVYAINDTYDVQSLEYAVEIRSCEDKRAKSSYKTKIAYDKKTKELAPFSNTKIFSLAKEDIPLFSPNGDFVYVYGYTEKEPQKRISSYAFFVYPKQLRNPQSYFEQRGEWLEE